MKPERLELRHFTAFRELDGPIDFTDIDLFALTGPTGAGKTSVIDAICFALYGAVPRTDGVEPVIALGAGEARVLLEFCVGDRSFRVARVVRRTKTGATTAEARLEREGTQVASGAKEVTRAVERLLGLSFEHFTRCVVLPQGEFAAFLHETPAGRQRLMRSLLDLGLFERVRAAARARHALAEQTSVTLEHERAALGDVSEETLTAAAERVEQLVEVRAAVETLVPSRATAHESMAAVEGQIAEADRSLRALAGLRPPDGLDATGEDASELETRLVELQDRATDIAETVEEVEKELAGEPGRSELEALVAAWARHAELTTATSEAAESVAAIQKEVDIATRDEALATARLEEATAALQLLERAHAAHRLTDELAVGQPCPVCRRRVDAVPEHTAPDDLTDAESVVRAAKEELGPVRHRLGEARADLGNRTGRWETIRVELEGIATDLAGRPTLSEVEQKLQARTRSEKQVEQLRIEERATTRARQEITRRRAALQRDLEELGRRYTDARDLVAPIGDLPSAAGSPAQQWDALLVWAEEQSTRLSDTRDGLAEQRERHRLEIERIDEQLRALVEPLHHDVTETDAIREVSIRALADAEHRVERLSEAQERATHIERKVEVARGKAGVAKELATLLSARGFEPWLMQEAMMALVVGANVLLEELSSGAYSLVVSNGAFEVVDHRNADETRAAKTLSGGETFLVSLALALSLAEHVRTVAGGAAIESVFIDEGFGTLDAASLDIVASVLHRLGERSQMVGIVSHVTELAQQMPVRFEVTKTPDGSRVERVDT